MSASANYASVLISDAATLTVGDTSRTAPTTYGAIFDPAAHSANGGLCERITGVATANTTASVIRIFRYDGTNFHLLKELPLAALTLAAGTAQAELFVLSAVDYPHLFPIIVPIGSKLVATVNDTQTGVKVHGQGGGC